MRLALETYTVRKQAKKNLKKTLEDIHALGFRAIELSKIDLTDKNIALIQKSRLHVSGIMLPLSEIQKNLELWIKHCKDLRCSRLVVSRLSIAAILGGLEPLRKFINQMNQVSFLLQGRGITLCFHHHAWEFETVDGKVRMDILLNELRLPIKIISDVYWLTYAHQDIPAFYLKVGSRLEGFHLRDLKYKTKNGKKKAVSGPVGSGLIDWVTLCGYSDAVAYAAIELKSKKPFKEIKESLDYIHHLQVGEGNEYE